MPSTPVLVLIALTVLACAFIVALLLKIRSQHIAAQPVFGSYGRQLYAQLDRNNPRYAINADKLRDYSADQQAMVAGSYQPEGKANGQVNDPSVQTPVVGMTAEEKVRYERAVNELLGR